MDSYDEIQSLSDYFSYLSSPIKMKQRVAEELNMSLIWSFSGISSFAVERDLTTYFVWGAQSFALYETAHESCRSLPKQYRKSRSEISSK